MSLRLSLHLLGAPRLELDNAPITPNRRKTLAVIAYLAVNRWQHHRDHLSALLWPEYDPSKALTNLRHIVWEVQQAIGEGWIVAHRDTIGLISDDAANSAAPSGRVIWVDVARFKFLIAQSRAEKDISNRIYLLTESVKLHRGRLLAGFNLKYSPHFNEWVVAEAEDLSHQLAGALAALAEDHHSLGQAELAIPYAQRLVALDPLNEASHRRLMQIYVHAGHQNAALKQYHLCEQTLRKELGVDPQPETRALYKQIRKREIKSIQPVPQKGTGALQHNLPFQISKFIGREKEMDEIADLITDHRLVTLVGTGGIGKTRLSLKVGEQILNEYTSGVWFVELASLSDPALVPQTAAKIFHIVEQAEESLTEKLIRVLHPKNILLILDNCEHLLDACAQLADILLKNCPNLKILTTSREPLGITGEVHYHVPSLGLPDLQHVLEKLLDYESIHLFEERARLVQGHFALTMENASFIAQICQRLDGIPLAIELAASRVGLLPTEQIASQLNESLNLLTGGNRAAPPRHQTLRACIDWSWNLLSEPEQILLRRLAVFAGGWTLDAAESVCAGDMINTLDVLDLLGNLVEKSLVFINSENKRYRMLETIHQYAHEKFQGTDEMKAGRNRHLAWILAWAEKIKPELAGRDQVARLKQAETELDNVRAAIEWGLATNQVENSMRILSTLNHFLDGRNPFKETRRWFEIGLSLREHLTLNTLAKTLSEAAWITFRQNDAMAGILYAEESLALAEALKDQRIMADALRVLGVTQISNGDFAEAERYFEKARLLCQELDDKDGLAVAVGNHALALTYQGNISGAIELLEQHLHLLDELDDLSTAAWFQFALGIFKALQGELEPATVHLKNSLHLYQQLSDVNFISYCLMGFATVASGYKKPIRAARLFGSSEALHESIGALLDPGSRPLYDSAVTQSRAMLDESAFASAWAEGRTMTMEQGIEYAQNEE